MMCLNLQTVLTETVLLHLPEITFLSPTFSEWYGRFQLGDIKPETAVSSPRNILLLATHMSVECPFWNRQLHATQHAGAWGTP